MPEALDAHRTATSNERNLTKDAQIYAAKKLPKFIKRIDRKISKVCAYGGTGFYFRIRSDYGAWIGRILKPRRKCQTWLRPYCNRISRLLNEYYTDLGYDAGISFTVACDGSSTFDVTLDWTNAHG